MQIFRKARFLLLASGIILTATMLYVSLPVSAEDLPELSSEKTAIIKTSCVSVQVVIQQIQYSDAANRVNRGQGYESLITRLMTPLNSRAALNGFNSSAANLATTTTRYQQLLDGFKKHYEDYDDALSAALRVKCQNKPADFYRHLTEARKQRVNLANDITALAQTIEEYRLGVVKLRTEVQ